MKSNGLLIALISFCFSFSVLAQSSTPKQSILIKDAWSRPAVENMNSAIYLTIENNGTKADTLIAVESNVADVVQVHETFKRGNDQMGMREVKFIAIPPKSEVEFKPGGYHIMLIDVQGNYKIGSTMEATLVFKFAGKIKTTAKVKPMTDTNKMKN